MKQRFYALLCAVVLATTLLSGCSVFVSPPAMPEDPCAWMSEPAPPTAGRFVLLLDRSSSTWLPSGPADGIAPDYAASTTLKTSLGEAISRDDVISIGTFDGTGATVRWFADKLRTNRNNQNSDNQSDDQQSVQTCLQDRLSQAQTAVPRAKGSDPYGALAMAGRNLAGARGTRTILIATDGLATTGCADLTHAGIGNDSVIDEIMNRCQRAYHGTINLRGSAVTMFGIGHPASGQPQPSTLQLTWLDGLWRGLCDQLKAACTISSDATAQLTGQPTPRGIVVTDPAVVFPPSDACVVDGRGTCAIPLDTNQLFDRNDAHISGEGWSRLQRVAAQILQFGPASVIVNGYTQAEASSAANRQLAQQRADAVAAILRREGVTAVRAVGHSGTAPHCPPQYTGGKGDDSAQQCNRRVDILATPMSR